MRFPRALGLAALAAGLTVSNADAIPAWARKYNMNCSGCHYPAAPRLNATGIRFRWAGYRMPGEIGEGVTVEQLSNYVSANGQVVFSLEKTKGQSTLNALDAGQASLFFGGPFGRSYVGWFEFEREAEDEFGLVAQLGGLWGSERAYGGFKAGLGHWLADVGIAGFDRPSGLSGPLPLEEPVSGAVPFAFAGDRTGAEAFYVRGRNRLSALVLEPIAGNSANAETRKDFAVTNQILLDRNGAGIMLAAYYGTILGVDTAAADARSNYWRLAASASRFFGRLEVLGGVVYGRDSDLPTVTGSPFASDRLTGLGYWLSGQYYVPRSALAVYGRYEAADPDRDTAGDATSRVVLGGLLPLTLPEYLRVNVEYALRNPQAAGAPSTHNGAVALRLTF